MEKSEMISHYRYTVAYEIRRFGEEFSDGEGMITLTFEDAAVRLTDKQWQFVKKEIREDIYQQAGERISTSEIVITDWTVEKVSLTKAEKRALMWEKTIHAMYWTTIALCVFNMWRTWDEGFYSSIVINAIPMGWVFVVMMQKHQISAHQRHIKVLQDADPSSKPN